MTKAGGEAVVGHDKEQGLGRDMYRSEVGAEAGMRQE